jgi:hypothetical protein
VERLGRGNALKSNALQRDVAIESASIDRMMTHLQLVFSRSPTATESGVQWIANSNFRFQAQIFRNF